MAIRHLFPTSLYSVELGDAALREELAAACWLLADEDEAGNAWCESEGYDGYTSYASLNDLPTRFPPFATLGAAITEAAGAFAKALHWDLDGRLLSLNSLWVNILGEGGSHSGHIHPGSVISGTYYLAMPEGAGALKLEDPRLPMMMAAPALSEDTPEAARRFVYLTPKAGDALFWESWLRHEVMPSRSHEPRLSISFNLGLD